MAAARRIELDALPRPDPRPLAVRLTPPGERAVRSGHPWIFEQSIRSSSREGGPGDVAVVFDRKNRFLAVGLYDPSSPIRIRVLRKGSPAQVGPELFRDTLAAALERRGALAADPQTTGYRLVHGEADRLPGLVLDRYGDDAVLKLYSPMWLPRLHEILPAIEELVAPRLLMGLVSRRLAASDACPPALRDGAVLAGPEEIGEREAGGLPFLEAGLRFEAHPREGHKTGFYLDQRENRGRLEGRAKGARVLDVFSHTGGFALHAARGGARDVVSVDASGPALAQGERHFELNRAAVASTRHTTLQGDAFETMDRLGTEGRRFDIVVVDPPSFAKAEAQREGALDAYGALTRLALGVLAPGGLLVQASCSSRVAADELYATVHRAARGEGRDLAEEERTGHPPDHPVTFPEGAYLTCLFARAG